MGARSPHVSTPTEDLRRLHQAARMAHGWDPYATDTRLTAVFREFGRYRWLIVPLAALVFAVFVWAIAALPAVSR